MQTKRNQICVQSGVSMKAGLFDFSKAVATMSDRLLRCTPAWCRFVPLFVIILDAAAHLFYPESIKVLKAVAFSPMRCFFGPRGPKSGWFLLR
jgi:hypothetical protein